MTDPQTAKVRHPRTPSKTGREYTGPAPTETDSPIVQRIGDVIQRHRKIHKLTLAQLAKGAEMSAPMLSRIENGAVNTSFESLERLCKAVGLTLAELFTEISAPRGFAQLVRKEDQVEVVRAGTSHGHVYKQLSYNKGQNKSFESFYISMDKDSEIYPRFRHPGTEFIYMLKGSMDYRHGHDLYRINPGDSFTFSGDLVHGPEQLFSADIHFVCLIMFDSP